MDQLTKSERSRLMGRVGPKNSEIEKLVFSHLRKERIHYQNHYKHVFGTPDIARPSEKKAIFIHSDFWHGWQFPRWKKTLSNRFWKEKISTNRKRDARVNRQLRRCGWKVLTVWEHSLKSRPEKEFLRIKLFFES